MWRSLILSCSVILYLSENRFKNYHHELSLLPPRQCQKECLASVASGNIHNSTGPLIRQYWCVLRHCSLVCSGNNTNHIKVGPLGNHHSELQDVSHFVTGNYKVTWSEVDSA
ncbi:uncharacterized protein [Pyxicephalus adspersus]|uniref:uncharacterized protein isoform X7 n=1 Tax=Pyxicephalus adspersus TaxID=30357 RepID=UPI003B5BC85D